MNNQKIIIAGGITTLIIVGLLIYFSRKKAKAKRAEIEEIEKIIDTGIGAEGEDAGMLLNNIKPDPAFKAASDVEKLLKAPGWLIDDNEAVFNVLKNKTKRQLASINQYLLQNKGQSLDDFLRKIFKEFTDCKPVGTKCTYPKYEQALKMIKNAT